MLGTFSRALLDGSNYQFNIIYFNFTHIVPFIEFLRICSL